MMNLTLILFLILFPLIGGIGVYFLAKRFPKCREIAALTLNVVELGAMVLLLATYAKGETYYSLGQWGIGLSFSINGFSLIYGFVSVFLWLMTVAFSKEYMAHYENKIRYYLFYLITLSGVMGVFLSGDFITTFLFFELMSFSSYPLIVHDEKEESKKAGLTYLSIAVISGMILLMGLFLIENQLGTLNFASMREAVRGKELSPTLFAGGVLVLIGFGAKAGMYPLHIWLPKAHAVAPAPASALLSGIMTKTGVFGIVVLCANLFYQNSAFGVLLLVFALITMVLGAILALFSVNLKRTLACSSMSQIGFILTGLAFGVLLRGDGALSFSGAFLHMINHSFIKLVLFMCAGVVVMNLHALNLNDIRGFGRKKPFLMIFFLLGALGIMGIPLFNGYASKTMIHEGILEYIEVEALTGGAYWGYKIVEYLFLFSGGLTIAYMTKLFVCLFVEKHPTRQEEFDGMKRYLSWGSRIVFVLSAAMILLIGVLPEIVGLPLVNFAGDFFHVEALKSFAFFNLNNLKGALISILIGALVYVFIVRLFLQKREKGYLDLWPSVLDLERYVYVPLLKGVFYLFAYLLRGLDLVVDGLILLLNKTILRKHVYHYEKKTLAYNFGHLFDSKKNKDPHFYAKKSQQLFDAAFSIQREVSSSFTFALAMICLGIVIIVTFLLIV